MNKKNTALFLVVLVAAAEANSVNIKGLPASTLLEDSRKTSKLLDIGLPQGFPQLYFQLPHRKWDGRVLSATINDYVDDTIHMIVPFIQQNGLDPMDLPDVVEGFAVKPLLITYSAWLKIHDGYMTGLVNVARSGDQEVNYIAKLFRVRVQLQFTNLRFVYKYLVKVMKIGPTGGIIATLNRFVIIFDVLIDFNNDEIHLQQFRMTDIGRLRVRFTGNILTDWLVNPVLNTFLWIFDTIIIKVVEVNIRNGVQTAIDLINTNIKDVIQVLESYN